MKKYLLLGLAIIILPLVSAQNHCTISNIGSCVVEKFFDFFLDILNAPIQALLTLIQNLLTQPVNIGIFANIWGVMVYILSMFYGLLLLITGFRFMMAGSSPEQREKAKSELTNILMMVVLVQASYLIYSLALELIASLTTVIFNMINPNFFIITSGSFSSVGLEITLLFPYLMTLLLTLILLTLRYICVAAGVVFFVIGVFMYFIGPLNSYGRLIINGLGVLISLPFIYSVILLISSELLNINTFQNYKIIVMIGAFGLIVSATLLLLLFTVIKAAFKLARPITQIVKPI